MKKFGTVLLGVLMCLTSCFTLIGCGPKEDPNAIKVWASKDDKAFITEMVAEFKANNTEFTRNIIVTEQGEDKAAGTLKNDPETAADVIHIPHDQLGGLVDVSALKEIPSGHAAITQITSDNKPSIIGLTKVGAKYYGIPDIVETYMMYYNKDIFKSEADVATYEGMKAIVTAKGDSKLHTLGMDLAENGYFSAAPFLSVGGTLYGADGTNKNDCTFNSASCEAMLKWMQGEYNVAGKVLSMGGGDLQNALCTADAPKTVAAVVDGPWSASTIKTRLGAKYGVAKLPTFDMGTGNDDVQMKSLGGVKMYVINNVTKAEKAEDAIAVARFLASKEVQIKRFNARKHMPSHKGLANDANINVDVTAKAFNAQNAFMVPQPSISEMGNNFYGEGHKLIGALFANKENAYNTDALRKAGLDSLATKIKAKVA